ncbi:MAG TPA: isoleucine--tRNA ligase, partial [Spirochaetia bacterium]|nr:isoleucine--tRNA ligase [Spirochaetia bacterium]
AYSFFVTYANIDGVTVEKAPDNPENPLDRWILSETERMVEDVGRELDNYDIQKAIGPFVNFIDLLNNWYIRRSRRRFWKSGNDSDKLEAYRTLHSVLLKLTLTASPFIPFITEEIFQNLKTAGLPESVHLCDFPTADTARRDFALEKKMETVRRAVVMGRALRSLHSLKNRQPLAALHLVTKDPAERAILNEMRDLIQEELNVKKVVFRENEEELVEYGVKPNYKVLGKSLGKDMKAAAELIEKMSQVDVKRLMEGTPVAISLNGRRIELSPDSVLIQRTEKENLKAANEGSLTVALDPELTPELVREGMIRDLVRGIQNLRKEKDFEVTDRITVTLSGPDELKHAVAAFESYLLQETLAESVAWENAAGQEKVECGDQPCLVGVRKVI